MIRKLGQLGHVIVTLAILWGSVAFLFRLHPSWPSGIFFFIVTCLTGFMLYSGLCYTEAVPKRDRQIRLSCVKWSLVALGLFGFSYLLVPMYHLMCHGMGMHGQSMSSGTSKVTKNRMLTVHLLHDRYRQVPVKLTFSHHNLILKQDEAKQIVMMLVNESDSPQDLTFKASTTEGLSSCFQAELPFKTKQLMPREKLSAVVHVKRDKQCPTLAQAAWGVYVFDTKETGKQGKFSNWMKMHKPYKAIKHQEHRHG